MKSLKQILFVLLFTFSGYLALSQTVINSFSPTSGDVGSSITISGSGFDATTTNNVVYFGGAQATVTSASSSSLSVTVPKGSTYDPITVVNTTTGKVSQSSLKFTTTNSLIANYTVDANSFSAPVNLATVAGAGNWYEIGDMITVGDFDLDGKTDIAKASSSSSIGVLMNTIVTGGSITSSSFSSAGTFAVGSGAFEIASGDIDGDGKLDLVSIGTSNFSILRNTSTVGSISFATKVDISSSFHLRIKLADVDGDGKIDVVTGSNYGSNFRVYLNTSSIGAVSFNPTPIVISGGGLGGSRHFTVGDVNMDGKMDVVCASENSFDAKLFINTSSIGSVSFASPVAVSNGYWYNAIGDFNNDGKNDIIALGNSSSLSINNYTSGSFTAASLTTNASVGASDGLSYVAPSDFNGDGKLDFVTSFQNSGQYVTWSKSNYTSGSFSGSTFSSFSRYGFNTPYQIILCDFNGDDKQDILTSASSNSFVQIAQNNMASLPTVNATANLSSFSTCAGTASAPQTITISGTSLTGNLTLSAVTGYEYSFNNITYTPTFTVIPANNTVPNITVYVRLASTASAGAATGAITVASAGATSVTINLNGTVNAVPNVAAITGPSDVCRNSTITLASTTTGGVWSSSNTNIATVNAGVVTGVNPGTAVISYTVTNAGCSTTQTRTINVNANPTASISKTDVTCFGLTNGSATVTVSGGTAPYTYVWGGSSSTTNVASNLAAGKVKCTVTDAKGCKFPNIDSSVVSTGNVNQFVASNGSYTFNFTDPIPSGFGLTVSGVKINATIFFPFNGGFFAGNGWTITGTNVGGSVVGGSGAMDYPVVVDYNGPVAGYVYGGSNNMVFGNAWNSVTFKSATITLRHELAAVINQPAQVQLTSATSIAAICNNGTVNYTPAVSPGGATYSWIRPSIAGISNASATGTGPISETLTNTTTNPITVPYTFTVLNAGCIINQIVTAVVNPTPVLTSTLTPSAVASGAVFNYTAVGSTGATFSWSRAAVTGISNLAGTGTGNISETLINTTTAPITVSYVYTISIGSCTNTQTVNVVINPTPVFASSLTPPAVCSGTAFTYTPSSATTGTTYSWSRATVAGISNAAATGTGSVNEILNNTTANPINVTYVFTLTANGVPNTQNVVITVNPTPSLSSSLTPPSICNNATFAYTPTSATAGATFSWTRASVSGISNLAGSGNGPISEVLNNNSANTLSVVYAVTSSANGCNSTAQNVTVAVQPSPTLSTTLNPNPACSASPFSYVPNSATTTITAAGWTRAAVTGISNAAASSASGIINETLVNTTPAPVTVNYVYNLAIGSCTNSQTVNVVVNPRPLLSSAFTATTCNNTLFTYTPTSATTGTTYAWSRAAVTGISNAAATGSGAVNETLINTTSAPINVTYVYTLTANGCSNNQNVVLTVYPTPVLSSSLTPSAVCSNAPFAYTPTSATSGTTYSWTRAAVTGISNLAASGTGAINETLINTTLTPVTVSYLITSTANGCSNTETITVVINPMPTLTSGLTVNALCNVSPLFYIASSGTPGTTFAWSRAAVAGISNATATGAGNIIETLNNTSADPITVNYVYTSTANGCSNPQTVSVVINPTPTLSSTQIAAPACNNTLFNYTATSATSGTTFSWSRAAVTGISNAAATGTGASISETLINTTSTPRTVTYVFTLTANNCTNTQNVSVVVNPTALLSSTLTPASICTNTTFAYTPTSATTGTTYTWSRAALTGISNAAATGTAGISEVLINTTPNPITVNYVYTLTANNCTNPTSQTVAVVVKPTPVLTSTLTPAAQCNAQSFNYTATSATAGTTYTWSRAAVAGITPATGSGNSGFILENLVNNTANPLTVNYVVNLLANGCANTQNFSLTINSTPVLSSTLNAAPICNATAFAYTPTSNTSGTTFAWSRAAVAGISNAAATGTGDINETLNNTTQTPLIVSYIYTLTANGCTNTQTVKVTVNPTPALTSLLTRFTCDNTVFNYTPTSATAGTTYTWSRAAVAGISNASATGTGVISETLLNTTNTPVTTTYVLTLTANGCTNTQSVDVTVNPTPQLSSPLSTTPICSNTNFTYPPSATIPGTSFAWTRATVAGISNAAGTGFGSINEALINTTPNPVTVNYVYVLTANNCSNIQNFNVTVNPSPALTSSLAPTGVCSNTPFAYSPTSATAGTTYSWTRATINGISNAAANGTGAINETLVNTTSAIASPKYLVTLTANGCSNTQFVQASIFPTPALSSGLSIAPVCSGVETNYIPASATSGTTYSWSRATVSGISNAAATGTGNIKETLTNTGNAPVAVNYVYTLTANTCTNTQTVATTINPKPATPTITALGPTTFCVEESVDLQVPSLTGGTYNWFLNGSNLGVNAATATVNIEGAYTASVTNQYGCTSGVSTAISISTPCSAGISGMPTVFTPNGDGENDELFAVIPGIKELNKFSIYNRWGNMVFDTKIIGTAWDGKFKDLDQPADVYFWYIEGVDSNGTVHKKQGKVTLAR